MNLLVYLCMQSERQNLKIISPLFIKEVYVHCIKFKSTRQVTGIEIFLILCLENQLFYNQVSMCPSKLNVKYRQLRDLHCPKLSPMPLDEIKKGSGPTWLEREDFMRSYMIQNFPILPHLYHPTLNTRSIFAPPSCGCWQSTDSCHSYLRGLWFLMTLNYRTLWPSVPYINPEENNPDLLRTSCQTLEITHSYTICGKIQSSLFPLFPICLQRCYNRFQCFMCAF